MKKAINPWAKIRIAVFMAVGFGLGACGGGGDDGGSGGQVGMIDLTVANRDTVAHATAASLLAIDAWNLALAPIVSSAGGVAQREVPQAASAGLPPTWLPLLPQRMRDLWRNTVDASMAIGREQPQVIMTDPPYACQFGGTYTLSANDLNNDGAWSIGEVLTVTYGDCHSTAWDVLNGTASVTLTGITQTSLNVNVSLSNFSDEATDGRHGMTLNGPINVDLSNLSINPSRLVATASGPVTVAVHTHLPFVDTVTLQTGFVDDSSIDMAAGSVVATLHGTIQSTTAGGAVGVVTETPITALETDDRPSGGVVRINGNKGVVRLTALSASQVKVELDAEADGIYESSVTDTWEWLL
jgi:hypothetical protein